MDGILTELWSNIEVFLAAFILGTFAYTVWQLGSKGRSYIQDKQVQEVVKQVVLYVEQVYGSEAGQLKKQIALETAQDWLNERGIEIDVDYLAGLIESVVFEELSRWKDMGSNGITFTVGGEIDPDTVQLE